MGKRLLDVDAYAATDREPAPAPRPRPRTATRSAASQAQSELRRNARSNYGRSGQRQAQSSRATVSRLVADESRHAHYAESETKLPFTTVQAAKVAAILSGSFIVGGGLAIAGVADVIAVAAQPAFLGAGLIAGALTYAAGGVIEHMRSEMGTALTVAELSVDGPGIISAHIQGDALETLPIVAGQSADWTFSTPQLRKFPIRGYMSCVPRDGMFRVMFRVHEPEVIQALSTIPAGTKMQVDNIAGANAEYITGPSLILAGGDGVVAARGLLEALPGGPGEVAMLYRVQRPNEAMLVEELREIGGYRGAKVGVIVGPKSQYPADQQPFCPQHLIASTPDIRKRNIFVVGPKPMITFVAKSLKRLGLDRDQVHFEIV